MIYYKCKPIWKDNNIMRNGFYFIGDNTILNEKFSTIEEMLMAAKEDGTCLRPTNWKFYKHSGVFGWCVTTIPIEWLHENGYLGSKISKDNMGIIYSFK